MPKRPFGSLLQIIDLAVEATSRHRARAIIVLAFVAQMILFENCVSAHAHGSLETDQSATVAFPQCGFPILEKNATKGPLEPIKGRQNVWMTPA